ncbi:sphingomyelinase C-like [Ptychodera flava]|uniref:sphingomyelinase C-like n=1 Tax=Ptychodera flava TaxID=63121 RepID=UPI00396AA3B3
MRLNYSFYLAAEVECDRSLIEVERPLVWIDDYPGCEALPNHCELFGMEYVCSEPIQNATAGAVCESGTKMLCVVEPAVTLAAPQPANVLKIITYNIFGLRYTSTQAGQRERTCRVVFRTLETTPDVDVIVFNELFMGGCFGDSDKLELRELLDYNGFKYTATVGENGCLSKQPPEVDNGGVAIASRWPILTENEKIFESYFNFTDWILQCKGVMYAKIQKTVDSKRRSYHIFATHMMPFTWEESDKIRVDQANEIYEFMKEMNIPDNEAVIYAGDFNANAIGNPDNAMDVLTAMRATQPKLIGMYNYTFDGIGNDLKLNANGTDFRWLDYIVYSDEHLLPDVKTGFSTVEVLRVRDEEFEVCRRSPHKRYAYPNTEDCTFTDRIGDVSDHYAVRGVLYYQKCEVGAGARLSKHIMLTFGLFILTAAVNGI